MGCPGGVPGCPGGAVTRLSRLRGRLVRAAGRGSAGGRVRGPGCTPRRGGGLATRRGRGGGGCGEGCAAAEAAKRLIVPRSVQANRARMVGVLSRRPSAAGNSSRMSWRRRTSRPSAVLRSSEQAVLRSSEHAASRCAAERPCILRRAKVIRVPSRRAPREPRRWPSRAVWTMMAPSARCHLDGANRGDGKLRGCRARRRWICARASRRTERRAPRRAICSCRPGTEAVRSFAEDVDVLVAVGRMYLMGEELGEAEAVLRRAVALRSGGRTRAAAARRGDAAAGRPRRGARGALEAVASRMNDPWTKTWVARALDYSELADDLGREGSPGRAAGAREARPGTPTTSAAGPRRSPRRRRRAGRAARRSSGRSTRACSFRAIRAPSCRTCAGAAGVGPDDIVDLPTPGPGGAARTARRGDAPSRPSEPGAGPSRRRRGDGARGRRGVGRRAERPDAPERHGDLGVGAGDGGPRAAEALRASGRGVAALAPRAEAALDGAATRRRERRP